MSNPSQDLERGDLVERLLVQAMAHEQGARFVFDTDSVNLMTKWAADLREAAAALSRAEAEREEMLTALKPFAQIGEDMHLDADGIWRRRNAAGSVWNCGAKDRCEIIYPDYAPFVRAAELTHNLSSVRADEDKR